MKPDEEYIEFGGRRFTPADLALLMDASGGNLFLLREAIASAELDRDDQVRTRHLCDHRCPEGCEG